MAVHVYTLDNISRQPISVIYQQGTAAAAGDVPQTSTGLLTIAPGKKVTIEAERVNLGQLKNFENLNLIRITEGLT